MKKYVMIALVIIAAICIVDVVGMPGGKDAAGGRAEPAEDQAKVDIDFTKMNQTMQMTHLYRLAANPFEFTNKTIRLSGIFLTRVDEEDGKRYYGCTIGESACSCCSPGVLDFFPKPSYKWPEDFPSANSRVTLVGKLSMYKIAEGMRGYEVPRLLDADVFRAEKR